MTERNAYRIHPRDSMYRQDVPPFKLTASNDEQANEPDGLIDSWLFIVSALAVVCALLWGAAQGWLT